MAGPSELKRLWRNYRNYRAAKKEARQASWESLSSNSKDSIALDDGRIIIVGMGLDSKEEEEYAECSLDDDDPRFINNPYGIGCSRTYEEPYAGVENARSASPALPSFPNLGPWKPEDIDMVEGKRKGRMPDDSAEDRYKLELDGLATRSKFSAKRFSLVRKRQ